MKQSWWNKKKSEKLFWQAGDLRISLHSELRPNCARHLPPQLRTKMRASKCAVCTSSLSTHVDLPDAWKKKIQRNWKGSETFYKTLKSFVTIVTKGQTSRARNSKFWRNRVFYFENNIFRGLSTDGFSFSANWLKLFAPTGFFGHSKSRSSLRWESFRIPSGDLH